MGVSVTSAAEKEALGTLRQEKTSLSENVTALLSFVMKFQGHLSVDTLIIICLIVQAFKKYL